MTGNYAIIDGKVFYSENILDYDKTRTYKYSIENGNKLHIENRDFNNNAVYTSTDNEGLIGTWISSIPNNENTITEKMILNKDGKGHSIRHNKYGYTFLYEFFTFFSTNDLLIKVSESYYNLFTLKNSDGTLSQKFRPDWGMEYTKKDTGEGK